MREARIDESVCAIDYRWPMGGTGVLEHCRRRYLHIFTPAPEFS
jgi:hypothetical protein